MKKYIFLIGLLFTAVGASAQQTMEVTLHQCREMALQHDEQLKVMDNKQMQAEIDKQVAFINYLPSVDASVMSLYQTNSSETMGMRMIMHGMYTAGITLQQTIYAGGRIHAGNDLAEIGRQVAIENLRKSRQEVLADVDHAYWSLVSVQQKVAMLESYVSYMQALYDRVKVSVDAEMAVGNDLLRIDAKKSEIEYNLQKAQTGAELCSLMLSNIIGMGMDVQVQPADKEVSITAPENLDEDISALPEVKMMNQSIAAKEKQVKMTRGEYLPSVVGLATYSKMGNLKMEGTTTYEGQIVPFEQKISNSGAILGIMLSVPISGWGEGGRKIKRAKLDVQNAKLEREQNLRLLNIQARNAVRNVQNGYLQILTAEKGALQNDENLRVMNERYDASMATLTDLLDAQSQWHQSQSNLIEAKTQYRIYQTDYLKAVGRLEQTDSSLH